MTAVTSERAAPIDHRQVLVVFSGLVLAMLLAALDSTIVSTALPTIVGELGGLAHLSWVITAYLLAQTIVTPLYGKLGDLYGRKVVLQAGIVLFLIGSMLCGLSRTMGQLILFRAVQGLGGGVTLPWTSPLVVGLGLLAVVALGGFVAIERRASEAVLPLRLFANRAFTVASALALVVGFALFGSVTYLPVFLQVVHHASPTASGLEMLPLMGGMLFTSILSGQLISRTGRYKVFPVVGTAVMSVGLWLLSRLGPDTSRAAVMLDMLVLGLGLGMVMQVLVIAVQNA